TLDGFLAMLPGEPADLIRADKELCPDPGTLDANSVVDLLLAHPKLMQRPVAVLGDRAVIARPFELVLELLD
ncbi:MAG: ArsC/Spx/MgsR family protein, partial [Acidimicrobiales bacterium]|nr:ArsC/Spx/MgsR family protein [Acidimicrobiales bacterium]